MTKKNDLISRQLGHDRQKNRVTEVQILEIDFLFKNSSQIM